MRILLYEYITGGGLLDQGASHLESLRAEGDAMVKALAAEFAGVRVADVHVLRDDRLPLVMPPLNVHRVSRAEDELPTLATLAAAADWTVLIAPEIDGILLRRARLVEEVGGRLLSPSSAVIKICTNKRVTAERLRECGVPTPTSVELKVSAQGVAEIPTAFSFPAVLKRTDGAGSLGMRRIENAKAPVSVGDGRWMLEELVPGTAASAAVLCGPGGHVVLPAFVQQIDPNDFSYAGGARLAGASLQSRARRWAAMAAETLPEPVGYLGVDMVLGESPSGADDAVVEVNPRLTTSFVGLAAIARTNLAQAMLQVAGGEPLTPDFSDVHIMFSADGTVAASMP